MWGWVGGRCGFVESVVVKDEGGRGFGYGYRRCISRHEGFIGREKWGVWGVWVWGMVAVRVTVTERAMVIVMLDQLG